MNFSANLKDDDLYEWVAIIMGPLDSVYEGGIFVLDIRLSPEYPYKPPKVKNSYFILQFIFNFEMLLKF